MIDVERLHPDDVEAIAALVAAHLAPLLAAPEPHEAAVGFELVSAGQLRAVVADRSARPALRLVAVDGEWRAPGRGAAA